MNCIAIAGGLGAGILAGLFTLAMSSDGRFLLTGSYDDTACLWEVAKLNP
jgi:WD40 repeat protein